MLLGLLFATIVIALGAWMLARQSRPDPDVLLEARQTRVTATTIYCLDCAGDALLPVKTFLTTAGRCAACFGRSYALASAWSPAIKARLQKELRAAQARERTRKIERQIG